MSIELLLFLAFFVVLPLVQMLIKASQKDVLTPKTGRRPQGTRRPPARAQQAPGQSARREAPVVPSLPVPVRTQSRPPARVARPAPKKATPPRKRSQEPAIEEVLAAARRLATPPPRPVVTTRRVVPGLGSRRDLRRAIVLTTILGPPRSTRPHAWPQHADG